MKRLRNLSLFCLFFSGSVHSFAQCSELFISAYVCASANTKAVEIYNPTSSLVNLTNNYRLTLYANGSSTPTEYAYLKGVIPAYGTFVLANGQVTYDSVRPPGGIAYATPPCDTALQRVANQLDSAHYNSFSYFNGDDAFALDKFTGGTWVAVDIFAVIGERPLNSSGTYVGWWNIAPYNNAPAGKSWTKYHTLVRKASVTGGVTTNPMPASWNPSVQYDSLPNSTTSGAHYYPNGQHTCNCNSAGLVVTAGASCGQTCNAGASASMSGGTPPYTFSWSTSPPQTTSTVSGLCPGTTYTVSCTDHAGLVNYSSFTVKSAANVVIPAICAVTSDSLSTHNIILWDKTPFAHSSIDSFIIYREISTNNYKQIGAVSIHALSLFNDTVRTRYFPNTGNPNAGSYRYKIALRDTCGTIGTMSPYHNTIYMVNNNGNFSWAQPYTIEGGPSPVNSYVLLRDDYNTGNWHAINSVAGTQQSVSDPAYSSWAATANWRIQTIWNITCTPTYLTSPSAASTYSGSLSNAYKVIHPLGVGENQASLYLKVFPNPSAPGLLNVVSLKPVNQIRLYNLMGKLVYEEKMPATHLAFTVNTSLLPKGWYMLHSSFGNGQAEITKIVIQ